MLTKLIRSNDSPFQARAVLLSESCDGTVKLWDLSSNRCTATFACFEGGWVMFLPDGRYKACGDPSAAFRPAGSASRVALADPLPLISQTQ